MEAYFDNSATTIVTDSVKDIVVKTMTEVLEIHQLCIWLELRLKNILKKHRKI